MRTITLEEHFISDGFKEAIKRSAADMGLPGPGEFQARLADLGSLRLKDMDTGGIDLQVISHIPKRGMQLSGEENEHGRAFLDHVSLSPADKEKISHLNAERLLKLPQA